VNVPEQAGTAGDDHPVEAIGRRLEVMRKRQGWTYRQMATRAGVPPNTLHHWIKRRRRAWKHYELRKLVKDLGEDWTGDWEHLWRRNAEADSPRDIAEDRSTAYAVPAPFQLPATTTHFTGRADELARLLDLWPDGNAPGRLVISAVGGMAGVGKTALVTHAAHRLACRFPDGNLFLDLHGFTPDTEPTKPEAALGSLLCGLGVPGHRIPSGLDARAAL
jgi:transcriptional regulator with XRE-family HTH domain